MAIARLPIATSLFPEVAGGGIPLESMGSKNCIFSRYPDGRPFATQRYPINAFDWPGALGNSAGTKGRGIYFWNFSYSGTTQEVTLIVNDDTIYTSTYQTGADTISSGKDPVFFFELGDYLILTDPENNEVWYATKAAPGTFTQLTNGVNGLPFDTPSNVFLVGGGAVLNGTLYLMDTDGNIWNCNINDPTTWSGIDFIEASRSTDSGVFLTSHHDNIVAISAKSIEFFFDAGNPVGSPLQRREDIFYNIGCFDRKRVANTGDTVIFIGAEKVGTIGVYILQQFQVTKVSDDSIDRYLNNTLSRSNYDMFVAASVSGERTLFFMTACYPDSTGYVPTYTAVYDITYQAWTSFTTGILDDSTITCFPIIANSERGIGSKDALMIMSSGDCFRFDLTGTMWDSRGAGGDYFAADYLETQDDYISDIVVEESANLSFVLITRENDFDTLTNKFCHYVSLVGTVAVSSENASDILVSYTDDIYNTYSNPRALSTSGRRKLTRQGKFKRRAYKLQYTGVDRLLVEGVEVDARASSYA